MKNVFLGRSG